MATTEVTPAGVQFQGNTKVMYVPLGLAVPGVVSLNSDVGHTGAKNISYALTASGFALTGSQNKGTDSRLGSKQVFEALGYENFTLADIVYIDDPQQTGQFKGALAKGNSGVLLVRFGVDAATDWAIAQIVNKVVPVTLGVSWEVGSTGSNDEFAKVAYQQVVAVTGAVLKDIAITT